MRSTTVTFGLLLVAATAVTAQDKMGSADKAAKSTSSGSSSSSSGSSSSSNSAPAQITKSTYSTGAGSFPSASKSYSSGGSASSARSSSPYIGDLRTKSQYTRPMMGADVFADKQSEVRHKQLMDLRKNAEINDFLQRVSMELAHKQAKERHVLQSATKNTIDKVSTSSGQVDLDPPAIPPVPNKSQYFTATKATIPIDRTVDNYNRYWNDYYNQGFYNGYNYGFCSPVDLYWARASAGYGYAGSRRSYMQDWWLASLYMSPGWNGGYNNMFWSPFYGMNNHYGYGYGSRGGYGYGMGGMGSLGCASYMGYYDGLHNRENHTDNCAVVTVDTYGDAKYQLRVNPSSLKVNSAEALEDTLNKQLSKNETIFLVDEEGYELQLTPGTARKFNVEHCQQR